MYSWYLMSRPRSLTASRSRANAPSSPPSSRPREPPRPRCRGAARSPAPERQRREQRRTGRQLHALVLARQVLPSPTREPHAAVLGVVDLPRRRRGRIRSVEAMDRAAPRASCAPSLRRSGGQRHRLRPGSQAWTMLSSTVRSRSRPRGIDRCRGCSGRSPACAPAPRPAAPTRRGSGPPRRAENAPSVRVPGTRVERAAAQRRRDRTGRAARESAPLRNSPSKSAPRRRRP